MNKIIIIGASANRERFSNKAIRAYVKNEFRVYPINPKEEAIFGIKCFPRVSDINDNHIQFASFYVKPDIGMKYVESVSRKGVTKIYLNPGTESDKLIQKIKAFGIEVSLACSIRAVGEDPADFD